MSKASEMLRPAITAMATHLFLEKPPPKVIDNATSKRKAGRKKKSAKPLSKNAPRIADMHPLVVALNGGRDASEVPGLADYSVLQLASEVGTILPSGERPSTLPLGWGWYRAHTKAVSVEDTGRGSATGQGACSARLLEPWPKAPTVPLAVFTVVFVPVEADCSPIRLWHGKLPRCTGTPWSKAFNSSNKAVPLMRKKPLNPNNTCCENWPENTTWCSSKNQLPFKVHR